MKDSPPCSDPTRRGDHSKGLSTVSLSTLSGKVIPFLHLLAPFNSLASSYLLSLQKLRPGQHMPPYHLPLICMHHSIPFRPVPALKHLWEVSMSGRQPHRGDSDFPLHCSFFSHCCLWKAQLQAAGLEENSKICPEQSKLVLRLQYQRKALAEIRKKCSEEELPDMPGRELKAR